VWQKYEERGDVEKDQLDIATGYYNPDNFAQLTPDDPKDDCNQGSAIEDKGEDWDKSPLSKVYYKSNTEVMDYFKEAGRLKVEIL